MNYSGQLAEQHFAPLEVQNFTRTPLENDNQMRHDLPQLPHSYRVALADLPVGGRVHGWEPATN